MKNVLSKIWIPTVLIGIAAIQSYGTGAGKPGTSFGLAHLSDSIQAVAGTSHPDSTMAAADTTAYQDSILSAADTTAYQDSILSAADTTAYQDSTLAAADSPDMILPADTIPQLTARDTIIAPDSLRDTDPLRYRYYVELKDSLTRLHTRDSLRSLGDSLELHKLDSLIFKDSSETAYRDSIAWFNSLSRRERKKYLEYRKESK